MGIEIIESVSTKSRSGNCHVGMTEQQAKDTKLDFIFKEFKSLDKDKDKVLSLDEVMRPYEKKQRMTNLIANCALYWAGFRALEGLLISSISNQTLNAISRAANQPAPNKKAIFIGCLIYAVLAASIKRSANRMKDNNDIMIAKYHKEVQEAALENA